MFAAVTSPQQSHSLRLRRRCLLALTSPGECSRQNRERRSARRRQTPFPAPVNKNRARRSQIRRPRLLSATTATLLRHPAYCEGTPTHMSLLLLMATEPPPLSKKSSSSSLSPSWALSFVRRKSESKSPNRRASKSQPGALLSPDDATRSVSDSDAPSSTRSSLSRGRTTIKDMMNRLRSSSNVTLRDEAALQDSDFKRIDDWNLGFKRYNELVATRVSTNESYPAEDFTRISNILTKSCGGHFLHGLPESVFDFALLWCPSTMLTRKEGSQEPTWSWSGWEGAINFPFDPTSSPDLQQLPRSEGAWFKSEIIQYHIGPQSTPYTVRREKHSDHGLRIQYPPYFHAPRGVDPTAESNTLRFSAFTISAEGFEAEQLRHDDKLIPCSHLLNAQDEHCGVIMDFEESISEPCATGPFEFVLLSRNLRREPLTHTRRPVIPTFHPPNTPVWDGSRFIWDQEVVDFDEGVFAPGKWKVLNVMLIKWVGGHAERVAVARIHEDAWSRLGPVRKDIVLK